LDQRDDLRGSAALPRLLMAGMADEVFSWSDHP
jgi:hypothetical protein